MRRNNEKIMCLTISSIKITKAVILIFLLIASSIIFLSPKQSYAIGVIRAMPSKVRLSILPGSAKSGSITIDNPTDTTKYLKVYLEDWYYLPEATGSKDFKPAGTHELSCAPWISFVPSELKLPPYATQAINYTVKVPPDAAGGHYAILFIETAPSPEEKTNTEGATLTLAIRMGSLFYIEPEGTISREASLNNLKVDKSDDREGLAISLDFSNTGNVDLTAGGNFNLMDKKGMVVARGEFNNVYTFAQGTAELSANWKDVLPKGRYDLILTIDLGKALEEVNMGRGPIIVKEAEIEIGADGRITNVGQMR